MADMTGLMYKHLQIIPNTALLESASITLNDIENVLSANNVEPGALSCVTLLRIQHQILLVAAYTRRCRNIFLERMGGSSG